MFLLYDPAGFQESTGSLRYLDGTLPDPGSDDDWWNMVYKWTDCPVLAGLDLGEYRADTTHAQGGDSQTYLADFYVGMRGAWNTGTEENLAGGEELWQALTAGAVSTVKGGVSHAVPSHPPGHGGTLRPPVPKKPAPRPPRHPRPVPLSWKTPMGDTTARPASGKICGK